MDYYTNYYQALADSLIRNGAHTATKYVSPNHVVRATRKVCNRRIDKRDRRIEIMFTEGVPNYHARNFINMCRKAGEPFPVKKIQLTAFPKRRTRDS